MKAKVASRAAIVKYFATKSWYFKAAFVPDANFKETSLQGVALLRRTAPA